MTHAIVARQAGGPEVLTYEDIERPVPGPGQLLVKVGAAGVNFIDTYKRSGTYKVPFPFTPGSEAAGTVSLFVVRAVTVTQISAVRTRPAHWVELSRASQSCAFRPHQRQPSTSAASAAGPL